MIMLLILFALIATYYILNQYGWIAVISDLELLKSAVTHAEVNGGLMIIGLMSVAIVLNPIPSAPIAFVSGALYGHTWGTVYIVIGAQIGAMLAFIIARVGGRKLIIRLFGHNRVPDWIGTQNSLTLIVFLSRLVPFISFDLVSYGAGLTSLKLWRFSIATLFGLMPASFLLAHYGSEVSASDMNEAIVYIALIGLVVLLPLLLGVIKMISKSRIVKTHE